METNYNLALDWLTNPLLIKTFSIVFAAVVANFIARRLFDQLAKKTQDTSTVWDDALVNSIRRPLSWLIWSMGIIYAAQLLSTETDSVLTKLIEPMRYLMVIGLLTLFMIRFTSECELGFIKNGGDVTTIHAIGKLLRISIIVMAILTILQTFDISISGVLAFGGMGGIAVGFAAKDLLANFFGGLMIYLDRPFSVGDWVRSPDREIEGTVEKIGWRLTMIKTFDQRPLYVPNSVFASIALENPSRMSNRRIYETIGIRYADAAKIRQIVIAVREMLQQHPDIDLNKTLIVNFDSFSPSSMDFFVYTFTKTTNWVKFHGIKEDVLLKINDIIEANGAEIAFPTSTIHLGEEIERLK